jgi:hypothetical protein
LINGDFKTRFYALYRGAITENNGNPVSIFVMVNRRQAIPRAKAGRKDYRNLD